MQLPIDVIPGTNPPRFRWTQTFASTRDPQQCEGVLGTSVEQAVLELIRLYKTQQRRMIGPDSMTEMVAAQSKRLAALEGQLAVAQEEIEKLHHELSIKRAEAPSKKGK